ncbi:triosephosphate isomerase [Bacteroidia bacterium]|nr:triosephosphate isomerase [Bacteroidia bacterium]
MSKIIAGNWKMNGTRQELIDMFDALENLPTNNTVILCPPYTLLNMTTPKNFSFGAQDCSTHDNGAHTGDISAKMIADTGAKYVIVGHSERRQDHNETSELIAAKAVKAIENKLIPIICVGETLAEYESGKAFDVVEDQMHKSIPAVKGEIIVAYEPVWAIGTGKVATLLDIEKMHEHIASVLGKIGRDETAILYGGSVKPGNAAEIMNVPNVGGVLVGGASLKVDDFVPIIQAV